MSTNDTARRLVIDSKLRMSHGADSLTVHVICNGRRESLYLDTQTLDRIRWPRLASALHYAAHGIAVFPKDHRKGSYIRSPARRATTDPEQLTRWWHEFPFAGVGIPTGQQLPAGDYLVVLDADAGGEDSWDSLIAEYGHPPETPIVLTGGGGFHAYFKTPELPVTVDSCRPAIDLKGRDGQVVGAGSQHPGGNEYHWEFSAVLGDVPLARLDEWLPEDTLATKAARYGLAGTDPSEWTLQQRAKARRGHSLPIQVVTRAEIAVLADTHPPGVVWMSRSVEQSVGNWCVEVAKDEAVARALAPVLGIPASFRLRQTFLCPIHAERSPSASIVRGTNGEIVVRCWHEDEADGTAYLTFPEVWTARVTGRLMKLNPVQTLLRRLDLMDAAGLIVLPPISIDTARAERQELDRCLSCCAYVQGATENVALSARALGDWLGTSHVGAWRMMHALEREGVWRLHRDGRQTLRVVPLPRPTTTPTLAGLADMGADDSVKPSTARNRGIRPNRRP